MQRKADGDVASKCSEGGVAFVRQPPKLQRGSALEHGEQQRAQKGCRDGARRRALRDADNTLELKPSNKRAA
jgi:hypothetical protein